jgi:hypothetical protein
MRRKRIMNKQAIINQIAVLRQSAEQLENHVQYVLEYCARVDHLVSLDEVDWGGVALPVSAEDMGTLALTCVKRAVKLDVLITLASEETPNQALEDTISFGKNRLTRVSLALY